jgi:hypothetical protein
MAPGSHHPDGVTTCPGGVVDARRRRGGDAGDPQIGDLATHGIPEQQIGRGQSDGIGRVPARLSRDRIHGGPGASLYLQIGWRGCFSLPRVPKKDRKLLGADGGDGGRSARQGGGNQPNRVRGGPIGGEGEAALATQTVRVVAAPIVADEAYPGRDGDRVRSGPFEPRRARYHVHQGRVRSHGVGDRVIAHDGDRVSHGQSQSHGGIRPPGIEQHDDLQARMGGGGGQKHHEER